MIPKNIVIVNDFDYIQGGASKVAIQTANLLVESNNDLNVYFFSAVHDNSSPLNDKVINICTHQNEAMKEKNKFKGIINGIYNFTAKNDFKKLLCSLKKEETIIHVHGWTKALSSSVFDIGFKMNFKIVLTLHDYFVSCPNGGFFNYKKNEICHLRPLSSKCIKCNCDSRNYLFKIYRIIRQSVQTNIVKVDKKLKYSIVISDFSYSILKDSLNDNIIVEKINNPISILNEKEKIDFHKNKYYLYVGRVSKEKGVSIFCEAITKLKLKGIVVGDGSEKKDLEEKYNNIEFTGWKSSEDVRKYIRNSKCLVFPSKWYETAGLTVLEAQVEGIPVIVSNDCAGKEFVSAGKTGYTFKNQKELEKYMIDIDKLEFKPGDYNKYSEKAYIDKLMNFYIKKVSL